MVAKSDELEPELRSLSRRADGLEAAVGELRARLRNVEQLVVEAQIANTSPALGRRLQAIRRALS